MKQNEWQPIETAPKDGTNCLLHVDGWWVEGWWSTNGGEPKWKYPFLPSHGCGCCYSDNPDPVAWMPLPSPPTDTNSEVKDD